MASEVNTTLTNLAGKPVELVQTLFKYGGLLPQAIWVCRGCGTRSTTLLFLHAAEKGARSHAGECADSGPPAT